MYGVLRVLMVVTAVAACDRPRAAPAVQSFETPLEFERTGYFASPRLRESSGVAVSRRLPGILWTHNDSGDDPVTYATNIRGEDLGTLVLTGAKARDWEDMALGPCPERQGDCIYVADTGDNDLRRRTGRIYIAPEPDSVRSVSETSARTVVLVYTDRPYNIEALAVEPSGVVWLITKGLADTAILAIRIPQEKLNGDSVRVDATVRLDFDPQPMLGQLVTGAAVSPAGDRIAVRTYTAIFFYRILPGGTLERESVCWLGHREPQGEAVDFLNETELVLTSESERFGVAPISRVRCPRL